MIRIFSFLLLVIISNKTPTKKTEGKKTIKTNEKWQSDPKKIEKYLDLVIDGEVWEGNYKIIQGCGKLCKKNGAEYIEVEKMWKTWI